MKACVNATFVDGSCIDRNSFARRKLFVPLYSLDSALPGSVIIV